MNAWKEERGRKGDGETKWVVTSDGARKLRCKRDKGRAAAARRRGPKGRGAAGASQNAHDSQGCVVWVLHGAAT